MEIVLPMNSSGRWKTARLSGQVRSASHQRNERLRGSGGRTCSSDLADILARGHLELFARVRESRLEHGRHDLALERRRIGVVVHKVDRLENRGRHSRVGGAEVGFDLELGVEAGDAPRRTAFASALCGFRDGVDTFRVVHSLRHPRLSLDPSPLHCGLHIVLHPGLSRLVRQRLALPDLALDSTRTHRQLDGKHAMHVRAGLGEDGWGVVEVAFEEGDPAEGEQLLGRSGGGRSGEAEDGEQVGLVGGEGRVGGG